ncbi:MAG: C40 family peptidase [Akkermansiaceae bacterium]|nr:C40 family peptidase [Verrucomicrobiales bacterium]
MKPVDQTFVGIPWKDGGRTFVGCDCVGLAWLWLNQQMGVTTPPPETDAETDAETFLQGDFNESALVRGDVVFFREERSKKVRHVAIYLGENKYLHIVKGTKSRIENGLTLLRRVGCTPVGSISPREADRLCSALRDRTLGEVATIILLVLSVALTLASYLLAPSLSGFKNRTGRYGDNGLITQKNPEVPLPDILGTSVVAGNSVYQQLPDKNATVDNSPPQQWNQVIVLCSGPISELDQAALQINGVNFLDRSFFNGDLDGVLANPEQTKAAAVSGTINSDTYHPTVSIYEGDHAISVPVDIRAQYDRNFPVYGFSGCSYLVFRFADSSKFQNLNVTARIKCRLCRTFDADGFTELTATGESLTGADGSKVRFKLAHEDVISVSSLTVNGAAQTELSATSQTGAKFQLNKTKGFVEFISAPAAAATITITYDYYEREWTQNPANHVVYMLTEKGRGKGFPADRIAWADAVAARDYYDDSVTWVSPSGTFTGPRYQTNYAVDYRKPIQDHIQALLDACHSMLFLSNGKFVLRALQAESSVFSFDASNILLEDSGESSFEATLADRAPKSNRVKLFYHSEETLNAETEVDSDDEDNQRARSERVGNNGVVEENLKLPAITSLSQAERVAETMLRSHVGSNWLYKWKTNIQGLAIQPGDVVDVTHASLPTGAALLRIDNLEHDERDHLVINASEYVPSAYI